MAVWTDRRQAATHTPSSPPTAGTAAQEDADEAAAAANEALSAKEKAQLRRAQVRKAQIQHRQRKANYIKQLELDVVRIREMISQTERETAALRRENEAIRTRLKGAAVAPGMVLVQVPQQLQQQQPLLQLQVQPPGPPPLQPYDHVNLAPPSATMELFSDIDVSGMTVTLSVDETMGTPTYQISSSASSTSGRSAAGSPAASEGGAATPGLTPEQENMAINFILT